MLRFLTNLWRSVVIDTIFLHVFICFYQCFDMFLCPRGNYFFILSCWTEGRPAATLTLFHLDVQSGITRQGGPG